MGRWWAAALLLAQASAACAAPAVLPVRRPPAPVPAYSAMVPRGFASPASGWGLGATVNGHVVDLDAPPELWLVDSAMSAKDSMVGVGWRGAHASAVLGYGSLDFGSRAAANSSGGVPALIDASRRLSSGVIGFSFVLRPG